MERKRTTALVTSGLLTAGMLLGIGLPAQAADPYPALTLSKTAATSTHDLGDSITVSGDGCPVGDAATAYLLDGVFANDATFADIPDVDEIGANGGIVDAEGHVEVGLVIPSGSALTHDLTPGLYSVRLACYAPSSSNMDDWDVMFETRQITINGGELPTTTTEAPATSASVTTMAAPPTMVASAPAPAAPIASQPTYTG
jgi:hypothetical protein